MYKTASSKPLAARGSRVAEFEHFELSDDNQPPPIGQPWRQKPIKRKLRDEILERDNHKCQICGATNRKLHVHHKIKRKNGGKTVSENLITLCPSCHGFVDANDAINWDKLMHMLKGARIQHLFVH